jgi:hypothetical protein
VLAHDGLTKQLENHVDTQAFTVLSIFCLFEEQTMVDSFKLLGPDRKPVTTTAAVEAIKGITGCFQSTAGPRLGKCEARPREPVYPRLFHLTEDQADQRYGYLDIVEEYTVVLQAKAVQHF